MDSLDPSTLTLPDHLSVPAAARTASASTLNTAGVQSNAALSTSYPVTVLTARPWCFDHFIWLADRQPHAGGPSVATFLSITDWTSYSSQAFDSFVDGGVQGPTGP